MFDEFNSKIQHTIVMGRMVTWCSILISSPQKVLVNGKSDLSSSQCLACAVFGKALELMPKANGVNGNNARRVYFDFAQYTFYY